MGLDYGLVELWVVGAATLLTLICLVVSFWLMVRAETAGSLRLRT